MVIYNRSSDRHFKCRAGTCSGAVKYNLQEVSQQSPVVATCLRCGKQWKISINREKRSCCGAVIVKFVSQETNLAIKPIIVNERVRK